MDDKNMKTYDTKYDSKESKSGKNTKDGKDCKNTKDCH